MENPGKQVSSPVLVYDRIGQNTRETRLLVGLFTVFVLPAMAFLVQYAAAWLIMLSPGVLDKVVTQPQLIAVWIFMAGMILLGLFLLAFLKYRSAAESTLHLVGARPPSPEETGFVRTVENLCIGAGLPVPGLYVVDSWQPNAFSVGFSPERASLVVTTGLLRLLDRLELEGVIAHELSHIGNGDSRLNTTLAVMLRTMVIPLPIRIVLWLGLVMSIPLLVAPLFGGENLFSDFPPEARLLMGLQTVLVLWALLWPWVGRYVARVLAQRREFLADADAVLLTRYPEGLARALAKAASAVTSLWKMPRQARAFTNPALSHLFLLAPAGSSAWFDPHPPSDERIAVLAAMDAGIRADVLEEARAAGRVYAESPELLASPRPAAPAGWPGALPAIIGSALVGIRNGSAAMAAYIVLNGILIMLLGARLSADEIQSSLLVAGSFAYAVGGYSAASHYAPQRKLALLGACVILYFGWMVAIVMILMRLEQAAPVPERSLFLSLAAALLLALAGGAAGAITQAAILGGVLWHLLQWRPVPLLISERQHDRPKAAAQTVQATQAAEPALPAAEPTPPVAEPAPSAAEPVPPAAEAAGTHPAIPEPGHRIPCPHCGAMMADTDTRCVWCGYQHGEQT